MLCPLPFLEHRRCAGQQTLYLLYYSRMGFHRWKICEFFQNSREKFGGGRIWERDCYPFPVCEAGKRRTTCRSKSVVTAACIDVCSAAIRARCSIRRCAEWAIARLRTSSIYRPFPSRKILKNTGALWLKPKCPSRKTVVPVVGLEPTHPCGQQILSLPRLPFRHTGASDIVSVLYLLYTFRAQNQVFVENILRRREKCATIESADGKDAARRTTAGRFFV